MKKVFAFITCLVISISLFAQKPFQGYIKYTYKVMGDEAGSLSAMMPASMELYSSKKATLLRTNGGALAAMLGDVVSTSKETYMIKAADKTYSVIPNAPENSTEKVAVVKEEEVLTILGLSCQKYKVTKGSGVNSSVSYVWLATEYALPIVGGKGAMDMAVPGVPGLAMKTMITQMGYTVVLTATEFKKGKQNKKLFTIPKGFTKKDFDNGILGVD